MAVIEGWRLAQLGLEARLKRLAPDEAEGWDNLEKDIQALLDQISAAAQDSEVRGRFVGISEAVSFIGVPAIGRQQAISLTDGPSAATRLRFFTLLASVVGAIILVWSGYVALYADQPTFGALPTDYLTLFTWGIGGQTAFVTIANRLIGWSLGRTEEKT